MMDEQRTQESALVEEMFRQLKVVAESNLAVVTKLTEMDDRRTRRLDELDVKVVGLTVEVRDLKTKVDRLEARLDRLEAKVDRLEGFAADAGPRLERIENHFKLNKPLPRRDPTRAEPSKHHRRKSVKRT